MYIIWPTVHVDVLPHMDRVLTHVAVRILMNFLSVIQGHHSAEGASQVLPAPWPSRGRKLPAAQLDGKLQGLWGSQALQSACHEVFAQIQSLGIFQTTPFFTSLRAKWQTSRFMWANNRCGMGLGTSWNTVTPLADIIMMALIRGTTRNTSGLGSGIYSLHIFVNPPSAGPSTSTISRWSAGRSKTFHISIDTIWNHMQNLDICDAI